MTIQSLIANLSFSSKLILGLSIGLSFYLGLRLLVYFANKDMKNMKFKKLSVRKRLEQEFKDSQI